MWFKNIQLYQFQQSIAYQPDTWETHCEQSRFTPCSALKPLTAGFVSPIDQSDEGSLVFASQGFMLMCVKIQEKLLPPSIVREQHKIKIKELEEEFGNRISKSERQRIKEELQYTLLTKALDRSSVVYLYINTHTQHLIIDTQSQKKLQLIHQLIQPITAGYDLTPLETVTPSSVLTQWVKHRNAPTVFSVLDRCTLQDSSSPKTKMSLSHVNLFDETIDQLLEDHIEITQLRLNWDDKLSFTIKNDFSLSQLNFSDDIKSLAKDNHNETDADRFASDFFIMSETISHFLADLCPLFVDKSEAIQDTKTEPVAA